MKKFAIYYIFQNNMLNILKVLHKKKNRELFTLLLCIFQHLNKYLEICTAQSDSEGIGKACDAIAKAYAK